MEKIEITIERNDKEQKKKRDLSPTFNIFKSINQSSKLLKSKSANEFVNRNKNDKKRNEGENKNENNININDKIKNGKKNNIRNTIYNKRRNSKDIWFNICLKYKTIKRL